MTWCKLVRALAAAVFVLAVPAGPAAGQVEFDCGTPDPAPDGVYANKPWPGGLVYYQYNPNANPPITPTQMQRMEEAMAFIEDAVDIQFIPWTSEPNYITITHSTTFGTSSSSSIGMAGGQQFIRIWQTHWDLRGVLLHEVGHALGLYHEHQRSDRDDYVEIMWENVLNIGAFNIVPGTLHGVYDFESVMHYNLFGPTKGPPTIRVRHPYRRLWQSHIGQFSATPDGYLSAGDVSVLKHLYGGDIAPAPFTLASPAYGDAVGAGWPPAFGWDPADGADSYRIEVDDDPLFRSPEIDQVTVAPSLVGGPALADDRLYFWRVTASNGQGATGAAPLAWMPFYTGAYPSVVYVDDDAPPGGTGLSWSSALQEARLAFEVAVASDGAVTEVRIAEGTYTPDLDSGDRDQSFWLPAGCAVLGGYAGVLALDPNQRDPSQFITTLSGDLNGDDGPGFANNAENAWHVVMGLLADGGTLLDGFTISGGNADGLLEPDKRGGGLWSLIGEAKVSGCTFAGNNSAIAGGGVFLRNSGVTLDRCELRGNRSTDGGGLHVFQHPATTPVITNSLLAENESTRGAGASVWDSVTAIVNCTFADNAAALFAGGLHILNSSPYYNTSVGLHSSVLWGNTGGTVPQIAVVQNGGGTAKLGVSYSQVEGGAGQVWVSGASTLDWLAGNAATDPLFLGGGGSGSYGLLAGSPCIDAGNNDALPAGLLLDLSGLARFVDDPATPDTGLGTPPLVDKGAYEFAPALCYADCDQNGTLNIDDFLCFQLAFALQDPYADCDGNSVFNIDDFLCFQLAFALGCP